jgi:hypothetical protein
MLIPIIKIILNVAPFMSQYRDPNFEQSIKIFFSGINVILQTNRLDTPTKKKKEKRFWQCSWVDMISSMTA